MNVSNRLQTAVPSTDDALVLRPQKASVASQLRGTGRGLYGPDPATYVRALRDEWEERLDRLEA